MTAPFDPELFLRRLWAMDSVLVASGFHAFSPWWRKDISRFIRALAASKTGPGPATLRRWVIRAGRRAGKSSAFCRLAVAWSLWGSWSVPRGDTGVISFVSVSRGEASARIKTIREILTALGESFEERGDELLLVAARPALFKVFPCNIKSVGHSSAAIFGDEVAKWESRETLKNPAQEVFSSLMPTLASMEYGFAVVGSSVWGEDDYHAQLFAQGDSAHQIVSSATTWQANPSLSEADTHALEPDERVWSREYSNEVSASISDAFDRVDVLAAFKPRDHKGLLRGGFVAIDASSLVGQDGFVYMCGRTTDIGEIRVMEIGGWEGTRLRTMTLGDIVVHLMARARAYRARVVYGDQRESAGLHSHFAAENAKHPELAPIGFRPYAWTEASKENSVQYLRRVFREGQLFIPEHPVTQRQCTGLKAHLMPSGKTRYVTGGADYVSCLITLAHAALAKELMRGAVDWSVGGVSHGGRGWGGTAGERAGW